MATWPSSLTYSENGYGYTVEPNVTVTEFNSLNTRQRRINKKRDDIFSIQLQLTNTAFGTFRDFVETDLNNGADEYTGPYFTSDVEYTGTLQIIDGKYDYSHAQNGFWNVSFTVELKNRDLTQEGLLYDLVNEASGFSNFNDLIYATEIAVNFNNL